jgi:hypothetical protein
MPRAAAARAGVSDDYQRSEPRYGELTVQPSYYTFVTWALPMYKRDSDGLMAVDPLVMSGFSLTRVQSTRCFPRQRGGGYGSEESARWNLHSRMVRRSSAVFRSADLKSGAQQPHHKLF